MKSYEEHVNYLTCLCEGCMIYRKEKGIPEPNPNAVYNSKVREIAEELAKAHTGDCWPNRSDSQKEADIRHEMTRSRAMVAKMAEAFEEAFILVHTDYNISWVTRELCKKHLIERGLIPAKPEDNG